MLYKHFNDHLITSCNRYIDGIIQPVPFSWHSTPCVFLLHGQQLAQKLKCRNKILFCQWSLPLHLGKQPQTTTKLDKEPTIYVVKYSKSMRNEKIIRYFIHITTSAIELNSTRCKTQAKRPIIKIGFRNLVTNYLIVTNFRFKFLFC